MTETTDPRFKYRLPPAAVSVETYDQMIKSVLAEGTKPWDRVWLVMKVALFTTYFIGRKIAVDFEKEYGKQQYEQDHGADNQDEVDQPEPGAA